MAELGLPTSEVMQEHLQNLMSQGYKTAAELATCHVPEDPASLVPVGGGGTSWRARRSTSGDLLCHHTDFSACCCSSMAWNFST
jgi:hypothetical protein